jgi:hypothetical protein
MEADVPHGSPVSPIIFAINTPGLIQWVEERVQAEGLSFVDHLRWVATRKVVNWVVERLEAGTAERIEWASRRDLQFGSAKMESALFTLRKRHKKPLRPKLTAKIHVGNGFVQFNKEATRWLGVWMDAHLTFKQHHNRCMKKARAAEAQLRALTKMHGIVPERVRAVQIASVQAIALYGSERWSDPREIGRREDLPLLLNRQAGSILGTLPTTPMGALMRESRLTPAPVALDAKQQRFTAMLASLCAGSKLTAVHDHHTSGEPICSVITKEHKRGGEGETMRWPNHDEQPAVKTITMREDTVAQRAAIRWTRERGATVGARVGMWWTDGSRSDDARLGATAECKD